MSVTPPAYAWDWFSRQRLLWRESRARLAASDDEVARRYTLVSAKPDVIPMLRSDYPDDSFVRDVVRGVVADLVFLGNTDRSFGELGVRNPPRGLRWWWRELTGEDVEHLPVGAETSSHQPHLPDLDDVMLGYGD